MRLAGGRRRGAVRTEPGQRDLAAPHRKAVRHFKLPGKFVCAARKIEDFAALLAPEMRVRAQIAIEAHPLGIVAGHLQHNALFAKQVQGAVNGRARKRRDILAQSLKDGFRGRMRGDAPHPVQNRNALDGCRNAVCPQNFAGIGLFTVRACRLHERSLAENQRP